MNDSTAARLSATISKEDMAFLDRYQRDKELASRSAALHAAIIALRHQEHAQGYKDLGEAQRAATEKYPADNSDGLTTKKSKKRAKK